MRTNESSLDFISKPCSGQCLWQEVHPGPCIKNKEVKCVWIIKVGVERVNWFSAVGDSKQWGSMVEWKCTQRWKQAKGSTEVHWGPQSSLLCSLLLICDISSFISQLGWGQQNMLSHLNSHQTKFQLQYGIHQIFASFLFQSGSLTNITLIVNVVTIVVVLGVKA